MLKPTQSTSIGLYRARVTLDDSKNTSEYDFSFFVEESSTDGTENPDQNTVPDSEPESETKLPDQVNPSTDTTSPANE